jgi:hypothetical protein
MCPAVVAALSPLDWAGDDCDDGDEGLGFLALEAERSDETLEVRLDEGSTVIVRGYARDCGQTLKCTGLTSWRGGENLARWLYLRRAELRARTCLELGAGLGLCSSSLRRVPLGIGRATSLQHRGLGSSSSSAARPWRWSSRRTAT